MAQTPMEQGGDASNANNFRDPFISEVNPRTGKLRISIAAPVIPGLGGLDVDLGIDYGQFDSTASQSVLGLPPMWNFRLSYIAGGRLVIQGSRTHLVDHRWPRGMKYYALQDMKLETFNEMPALPFDEAKDRRYLNVLTFLNGRKQYFDRWGRLIASADAHGNHILYEYQAPDDVSVFGTKLQRIVDTYGQVYSFTYPDGALEIALPSTRTLRYEFDASRRLTAYQDPAGRRTTFTHAGGERIKTLLSRIDSPEQVSTTFGYGLLLAKAGGTELRLDVVTEVTRTFQGTARTTRYQYDPDGNHRNYTGNPTYSLSGGDSLLESSNHRYRYSSTVDDGITRTRHTYNRLHLETRTDVYSSEEATDLISTTLFSYPGEGADGAFSAVKRLPACYQQPSLVEVRVFDPCNTQRFRAIKKAMTFNGAGQVLRTENSVAADGVTFQLKRVELHAFDERFGVPTREDIHDHHATGEFKAEAVITRTESALTSSGSQVASSQTGFVSAGTFKPSRVNTYGYDAHGRVASQADAWVTPSAQTPPSATTRTAYRHDAEKHLLTVTTSDALGNKTSQIIDTATGMLLSETDARSFTTQHTYDALGRRISTVDPLTQTTLWTYDDAARTSTVQHPNGYQVIVQMNGFGQELGRTDNGGPSGAARTLQSRTYDAKGRLTTESGILGEASKLTHTYDSRGRPSQTTDSDGNVRTYTYDVVANTQTESFNGQTARTEHFDDQDHVIREETHASDSGESRTVSTGHDGEGRAVSGQVECSQDKRCMNRTVTRDILGNEIQTETQTSDGTTVIRLEDRDLFGNVTFTTKTLRPPKSTATTAKGTRLQYDAANRLVQSTTPLSQSETHSYDAQGNLTSRQDLAGTTFTHAYDALGLPTQVEFTEAGVKHRIEQTYDKATRRLSSVELFEDASSQSRIEYTYTNDGLLTSKRYLPEDQKLTWEYSATTRQLTSVTDTQGVKTQLSYTSSGRLQKLGPVTDGPDTLTFSYYTKQENAAHSGRLKTVTYGNGLNLEYTYDGFGRERTTTARAPAIAGTKTLLSITQTHDTLTGNILCKAFTSEHAPQDKALNHQVSYQYNSLGQLTQEEDLDAEGQLLTRRTYAYDAAGNVTRKTLARAGAKDESTLFTYDADNKLTSLQVEGGSARNLTHDLLGNLTDDGAGRTFQYNALGQLTGFKSKSNNYSYTYHPDGLRKSKCQASKDPVRFYYDAGEAPQIVNEVQGTKGASHQQVDAVRFTRQVQGGVSEALLHDQSHVVAVVEGKSLTGERISAYGEVDPSAAPGTFNLEDNPFGFTGEYRDVESGLTYLRARYYDPQLLRFISRDSLPLLNRYSYAAGNPVMFSDPSGHSAKTVGLIGSIVAAIIVGVVVAGVAPGPMGALFTYWGISTFSGAGAVLFDVAIAATAGLAANLVSSGVTALADSYEKRELGWGYYFNKELAYSSAVCVVGAALGVGVSTLLNKGATALLGRGTSQKFKRELAEWGAAMVGGGAENIFNIAAYHAAQHEDARPGFDSLEWFGAGVIGAFFAPAVKKELSAYAKQLRYKVAPNLVYPIRPPTPVPTPKGIARVDKRLDVPMIFEDWI
jgi:RHS repeat-associated protein